ncbi:hypothetical protein [Burkholderia seminalis]|uniref:hypothetical protein n=1 Tax=Burkholderia seminalis TaxID=488731 RepID=UPI00190880F4|nr:hypothetical protein [Burkholderia seminalis]MBJ9968585.1 hypothetical protein [Burkholderia seminalis]
MSDDFDVSVDDAFGRDGGKAVLIKFSAPIVELNVFVSVADVGAVINFGRKGVDYVLAGESANSAVHWKRDDGDVYILVGDDPEVWDISLVVDDGLIDRVASQIQDLLGN